MNESDRQCLFRVEKGAPDAEELAALTAVLLACSAARPPDDDGVVQEPVTARWQRLERRGGFTGPRTWQ